VSKKVKISLEIKFEKLISGKGVKQKNMNFDRRHLGDNQAKPFFFIYSNSITTKIGFQN
jgi:hypothetical protein